ncbi:MAG: aldo/keto reductase [Anaerolineae bacterium]|nr:aldo/keto reductase [Anaerolineae bacterium]
MQYRILGRTGLQVSAISLGTEHLLEQPRERAIGVIRAAIEQGINYFDVFWAQPQFRDTMGAAFQGHRDRITLAAHLGATVEDGQGARTRDPQLAAQFFHEFLTRYHTDHTDILMLHNCDEQADYDAIMRPDGLADLADRFRREGKARFIGFSGHTVATALQAVQSGRIDLLMFPINLAGHAVPGKKELLDACTALNVALVAMKPYAGGMLFIKEREMNMNIWTSGGGDYKLEKPSAITPVQCLSYVLAQAGVSIALPGCRTLDELDGALAYWRATEEEKDFAPLLAGFQQYVTGECVYCNHCLPCPSHIDIGQTIRLYEQSRRHPTDQVQAAYRAMLTNASDCIQCGDCETRCPFGVSVIEKMEQAAQLFA